MHNVFTISDCTLGVAVAVKATIGILPSISFSIAFILRYSGRKSWPHSEMQCASSTATKDIFIVFKKSIFSCFTNDSGATYNNLHFLLVISFFTCAICALFI